MKDRITLDDLHKAIESLKRNKTAESRGALKCDICGKEIHGYWLMVNLPGKQGAIIHADSSTHPCFIRAVEAIRKEQEEE